MFCSLVSRTNKAHKIQNEKTNIPWREIMDCNGNGNDLFLYIHTRLCGYIETNTRKELLEAPRM